MSQQESLFEKLGGGAAVDIFYRKVLSDDRISFFFEGVDMDKQTAKLTMAFGGPHNYSGLDMRRGHAHLVERGLNDSHVDAVIENFAATLRELNVSDATPKAHETTCRAVKSLSSKQVRRHG